VAALSPRTSTKPPAWAAEVYTAVCHKAMVLSMEKSDSSGPGQTTLDSRLKLWPYYHSVSTGFLGPQRRS